jgi:primosomal protein N' (replication factor Y) (superfamily II helicase)
MKTDSALFANVILPLPLNRLFTYGIPEEFAQDVKPGSRVIVQFGRKKIYSAIVRVIHQIKPAEYDTKDILSVVDDSPVIPEHLLEFWDWIATYYMCTPGDVYKAAIPAGLRIESETKIFENPDNETDKPELTNKEELILQLIKDKKITTIHELANITKEKLILPVVNNLIKKNYIRAEETIRETFKPKTEKYITLHKSINSEKKLETIFTNISKSKKQLDLLMRYLQLAGKMEFPKKKGLVPFKKLQITPGFSQHALKTLVTKNVFEIEEIVTGRLDLDPLDVNAAKGLDENQQQSMNEVLTEFKTKNVVLLHGVTGSGKTEIYIQLIKEQLKNKKQVLYLLPEIAITTQIINRLRYVFGEKVGVYHSRFPDSERVEIWNNLLKNDDKSYQVILGVRSAIFLPFRHLGLVIIDEEHENTFKQHDPAPRYHARDTCIVLADMMQAKCLLGTATPSVESYYNAKTEKYGLVELKERFGNIEMPEINLANMLEARKKRQMKSIFTPQLLTMIKETVENGEQVILFQNRRGFAPYLECDTCGWIPYCKNCDVSLTYHKSGNELTCHYCGYSTRVFTVCKACENPSLSTKGFGTEKIEDELKIFFPDFKAIRMDFDSTRSRKAYEKIIDEFESGRAQILVGTQMISKGLDFDNVGLVGILNADNMLNFPDFRAHERSYQLMAQVSGRAGRKKKMGKVLIQTSNPEHPVIKMVVKNDYKSLFNLQISERKKFNYPPFYRLIEITLKHKNQLLIETAAQDLARDLIAVFNTRVLGPESPPIPKMHNLYQKRILLKLEKQLNMKKAKEIIHHSVQNLLSKENYRNIQVINNVDPQ